MADAARLLGEMGVTMYALRSRIAANAAVLVDAADADATTVARGAAVSSPALRDAEAQGPSPTQRPRRIDDAATARDSLAPAAATGEAEAARREATASAAAPARAAVLLIADAPNGRLPKLLGDVERALRAIGVDAVSRSAASLVDAELGAARGLVVLGPAHARGLGARLPAHVQRDLAMVVCDALPALARGANGKRALWGELKRLRRELIARAS